MQNILTIGHGSVNTQVGSGRGGEEGGGADIRGGCVCEAEGLWGPRRCMHEGLRGHAGAYMRV